MTLFRRAFPALVSVCLAAGVLTAARPHYGGTLRVATTDAGAMRRVNALAYETLIGVDAAGGLKPMLATSWDADRDGRRWTIHVRRGVRMHDGSTLEATEVVTELRRLHGDWQLGAVGDALTIDPGREAPDLAWQLADSSNAIAVQSSAGLRIGSGPFRVERVDAGLIVLRAHDDYWASRPFVDAVEVRTGRTSTDQLTELEAGRVDLVSVQASDVRRVEQRTLRIHASRPLELFAIVFEPQIAASANEPLRRTLAAAIDRQAIAGVVLQGRAEPASALLPQWISGYAPFVVAGQGQALPRTAVQARRTLALRVGASDPDALAVAQRVAVSVREAGITLTVQAPAGLGPRFDMRLIRLPLLATTPSAALSGVMSGLGPRTLALAGRITPPEPGAPLENVLRTERALLEHHLVIPIVHVAELYASSPRLQSWNGPTILRSGDWDLANAWLATP